MPTQRRSIDSPPTTSTAAAVIDEVAAAKYIGMSYSFLRLRRYKNSGRRIPGPAFIQLGRSVRYRIKDLDAWLESRAQRSAPREPRRRR
jgi:predicted DNA-binding transcriptional regulator AlpA